MIPLNIPEMTDDKERIRLKLLGTGACAVGFAHAGAVEESEWTLFENWLHRGDNAGMEYMHNYPELRRDPRLLLKGAQTVISLAFSYMPRRWRSSRLGEIASYAYGQDYHKELRRRLKPVIREISTEFKNACFRICIDSAPVLERYWAIKAGIGFRGDNGTLIVPGGGSMTFLVEIITNLNFPADKPLSLDCGHCGACARACPGNALAKGGTIDCRKCISYLTIEHHGDWTEPEARATMNTRQGINTIFGCDICLRVCPHNRNVPPSPIAAFHPSETILNITADDIAHVNDDNELASLLPRTPLARAGIAGLRRNINR